MTIWEMSIVASTWIIFKHEKEGKDIMTLLDLCKVYFGSHDVMKYDKLNSFKLFFGTFFLLEKISSFFCAYHLQPVKLRTFLVINVRALKNIECKNSEKVLAIKF
jgi:hypothetical protein